MADHDTAYTAELAHQLCTRHTALITTAENDLALLRARLALVTTHIHDTNLNLTARQTLAQALGLPEPIR
ncbi:hypothetical protein ABZ383_27440 [Streptomyces sp. NPDC005900]|uniref:hypothetical protein n=1 Tax=Streptomyces sp. NPDC005900 TaxID=3154569 RepID=UPI0033DD5C47